MTQPPNTQTSCESCVHTYIPATLCPAAAPAELGGATNPSAPPPQEHTAKATVSANPVALLDARLVFTGAISPLQPLTAAVSVAEPTLFCLNQEKKGCRRRRRQVRSVADSRLETSAPLALEIERVCAVAHVEGFRAIVSADRACMTDGSRSWLRRGHANENS